MNSVEKSIEKVEGWYLGQTSFRHETGGKGAGTISTGVGDNGGVSYGSYQLSTRMGTLAEYLRDSTYGRQFDGLEPKSEEFNKKWSELARNDPNFASDQHDFIKRTHYDLQVSKLKNMGFDFSDRGRAVHDALWSTSVQVKNHTPKIFVNGLKERFGENFKLSEISDREIVESIQDYKHKHNNTLFKSSPTLWPGLLRRALAEKSDLRVLADSEAILAINGLYADWRLPKVESQSTDPLAATKRVAEELNIPQPRDFMQSDAHGVPNYMRSRVNFAPGQTSDAARPAPGVQPQSPVPAPAPAADGVLRVGARGDAVQSLQDDLRTLGYTERGQQPLAADGIYGADTRAAVAAFQQARGMSPTGEADARTLAAAQAFASTREAAERASASASAQSGAPSPSSQASPSTAHTEHAVQAPAQPHASASLHLGDRGAEVMALQQALLQMDINRHSRTPLQADGVFDIGTQRAVQAFQLWRGSEPMDGMADPATRQAIAQQARLALEQRTRDVAQGKGPLDFVDNASLGRTPDPQDAAQLRDPRQGYGSPFRPQKDEVAEQPAPARPPAQADADRSAPRPSTAAPERPAHTPPNAAHATPAQAPPSATAPAPADTAPPARDAMSDLMSDPGHPYHARYSELQQHWKQATPDRLAQFAAACHMAGFDPHQPLNKAEVPKDGRTALLGVAWPPGSWIKVDLDAPVPTREQSMQAVAQFDQQQAAQLAQFQQQRQQANAQAEQGMQV